MLSIYDLVVYTRSPRKYSHHKYLVCIALHGFMPCQPAFKKVIIIITLITRQTDKIWTVGLL